MECMAFLYVVAGQGTTVEVVLCRCVGLELTTQVIRLGSGNLCPTESSHQP